MAPADDRSAASSSLTVGKPVRIHEAGERCYYVEGYARRLCTSPSMGCSTSGPIWS